MRKRVIFITGASGEVGQALLRALAQNPQNQLLTMDLHPLPPELRALSAHVEGDLLNMRLLARLVSEYEIDAMYHLAALLSTRAEIQPEEAHQVNVEATLQLLKIAAEESQWRKRPVQFIFPSSIAAYGLPDRATKAHFQRVREFEWNQPRTMYGCNKLYCEHLGRYYAQHYRQGATAGAVPALDFRGVRFPGLLSADTVPSGGTSDYAPEMFHAAAQGTPYACFVGPETWLPFMAMPDAIDALLQLDQAPAAALSRAVYNVSAFSASADACARETLVAFPAARITWAPDTRRQGIVDTCPADVNDEAARRDWGFSPAYDFERTFREYLHPAVTARYASHR